MTLIYRCDEPVTILIPRMADYYYESVQHYVEMMAYEHWDFIADKEEKKQFKHTVLDTERSFCEWVMEIWVEYDNIKNKNLLLAMKNSVEWDKALGWVTQQIEYDEGGDEEDEENEVDDFEAPNTYPYKKCSGCGERKSCGNYNDDRNWECEDCGPNDDPSSEDSDDE